MKKTEREARKKIKKESSFTRLGTAVVQGFCNKIFAWKSDNEKFR